MNRAKRIALSATSGLMAVAGALVVASPAHATPGDHLCSSDPNIGIVCITEDSTGYNAEFWSAIGDGNARFRLVVDNYSYYDNGAFLIRTDSYNSYYFRGLSSNAAVCVDATPTYSYTSTICTPIVWG